MERAADAIDRAIARIAGIAAWAALALVAVTVFDVATRGLGQSSVAAFRDFSAWQQGWAGSTRLQEMEWHLHTILFLLCLGWAYARGAHVRIDIFRDRFGPRLQAELEIAGVVLFLLPFCALVAWFGADIAAHSFAQNESSASATGLPHRWIIKAVLPAGALLLAASGVAALLRNLAALARAG
jgi:TRAP-type mannitol/chloroaromatic compound transport system permease small subunit